jgi:putative membrane-bound dehydrogenase-like protein
MRPWSLAEHNHAFIAAHAWEVALRRSLIALVSLGFCLCLLLLHAGEPPRTGPATEQRFPALKVPAGFKATLFACDPLIEYPSVIAAGPKPGALFVAIDYMTGLGTKIVRRSEIRLIEDTDGDGYADKATVFANGFNSIQGLAYRDGTVYVMHAPFLTALRDTRGTGVADERKNLLGGLGLTPEQNPARLHCANGVVVGHDGWLYLALGDNGVNVPRPEGDRLIFNGGGILRCRPDGRDLHVFATGLRNIYDVALDAELNVFVRDNENDGGTYMIRVCHSFFGADHGYPYHYYERPDEALPPIGNFGLGSSAGGVCYLEPQFPAEYRGNLFFCEWGRSVVRYRLARAGSGFASVKEMEFAAGDPKDTYPFKPTDIVVQRDGALLVADYADGQRPKRGRGRIYRIAYDGDGKTPPVSGGSQIRREPLTQLDSTSYYERCDGQQAIERLGAKGAKIIGGALADKCLGERGRWHAIWALAHLRGAEATDDFVRLAKTDPAASVRAQAVRALADTADPVLVSHKLDGIRHDNGLAKQLASLSQGQDPRVLLDIVVALGRLRWAGAPDWLRENIGKPDAALAHAATQTLRRSGNWPAILKLVDEPTGAPMRAIALRALAERFEPKVVDGLIERLGTEQNAARRREYADTLARVYRQPGPWKYWGYRPPPRPANTVAWERTDAIAQALDRALADGDPTVRVTTLTHMQREKVPIRVATLAKWLANEHQADRVAAVLAALREQPRAETRKLLDAVVRDRTHASANRLTALAALDASELLALAEALEDGPVLAGVLRRIGKQQSTVIPLLILKLKSPEAQVRAAAIEALGTLGAAEGREPLMALLAEPDVRVRRAAAAAAGKLDAKKAGAALVKLLADADPAVRRGSLDSLRMLRAPQAVLLAVAALNDRPLELTALKCLSELGGPDQAAAVAEFAQRNPSAEVLVAAVRMLTAWRDRPELSAAGRSKLDRAVADIHGAGGILARWQLRGPLTAAAALRIVEQFKVAGNIADNSAWRNAFATGTEARVALGAAPTADGRWLATTQVAVAAPAAVEFLASSHGSLRVWLDGKQLYHREESRSFQIDSDRFGGTLARGLHTLLVEIGPSKASADFHLRFRRKSSKAEHEKLTQAALSRTGDAERGRKVFFDVEKSQCLKCHYLGDQGERIGPELTGIGSRFTRIYIVESILEPSRTIAPSYGTVVVSLTNGKQLSGVKIAETATTLTLADSQGQKHLLAKDTIETQTSSAVSAMPEGLEKRFSGDEFVDLIAFLVSQKERR